jgi:hypothetical protein
MQRIDPVFPDLLPLTHRLGGVPIPDGDPVLDPVSMRVFWQADPVRPRASDHSLPRRPVRLLVHEPLAEKHVERVEQLLEAGCGIVLMLDRERTGAELPRSRLPGQVVALAACFPELYGGRSVPDLSAWREKGIQAGVLLGLGPSLRAEASVAQCVTRAHEAGASFVVAVPLSLPAEDRHRAYDANAGENGDEDLENALFHSDLSRLATELEREAGRACFRLGLTEGLPGPASSLAAAETVWGAGQLLLWARRLDLLDEISSCGWQLRRAARALTAAGRLPLELAREDNLRVIPGFTPWVEAFARAVWAGGGEPFDEVRARWLAEAG